MPIMETEQPKAMFGKVAYIHFQFQAVDHCTAVRREDLAVDHLWLPANRKLNMQPAAGSLGCRNRQNAHIALSCSAPQLTRHSSQELHPTPLLPPCKLSNLTAAVLLH